MGAGVGVQRIILDTSSILFGFSNGRDVFEAAAARFPNTAQLISAGVILELKGLGKNRGKKGAAARFALLAIKVKKVKVDKIRGNVDRWILSRAASAGDIVITNDTKLWRALKAKGVRTLKMSEDGGLK